MAATQVFVIPELLEIILSYLPIHDIIRSQLVCRGVRSIVKSSPRVREARWYVSSSLYHKAHPTYPYAINPMFEHLGMRFSTQYYHSHRYVKGDNLKPVKDFETCEFDLKKLIYETPGSWCGMLAFQPPAKYLEIECYSDIPGDESMSYYVEGSTDDGLRMGDVMAVLAEAQNRQSRGVDRWAGIRHHGGQFWPERDPLGENTDGCWEDVLPILETMPDNVDLKVVVYQANGTTEYFAFSLRRLSPGKGKIMDASTGKDWQYELIMHEMTNPWDIGPYVWDWGHRTKIERRYQLDPVYKKEDGKYEAKMLRVRDYAGGYLEACRDVYKSLGPDEG